MDEEIQQWFTGHGRVIKAEPIPDPSAPPALGATLVKYTFEDGAVLTLRPAKYDNGQLTAPQEIVGRELPKPKEEKPPAAAAQPPKEKDENGRRYVWRPNPDGNGGAWEDVGPAAPPEGAGPKTTYQTGSDGKVYSIVATPGQNGAPPTTKVYDPDGKEVPGGVVPGSVKPGMTGTTASATAPLEGAPGWSVGTEEVVDAQGNKKTQKFYINPKGDRTMTPPPSAADQIGKPTGNTRTVVEGGKTVKQTEYLLPDQTTVWREQREEVVTPSLGPDAPQLDLSSADAAHGSYMTLLSYVDQQVRNGKMPAKAAVDALAIAEAQVKSVLAREQQQYTRGQQEQQTRMQAARDAESQRNNLANMTSGFFRNAQAAQGAPGQLRGSLIPGYLGLQARLTDAVGGLQARPMPDVAAIAPAEQRPPMAPPNAIGAGAVPEVMTPSRSLPEPAFRPQPEAQWSPPVEEAQIGAGQPVAAVGTYQEPTDMDARSREMLAQGYTPEEIEIARRRVLAGLGVAVA